MCYVYLTFEKGGGIYEKKCDIIFLFNLDTGRPINQTTDRQADRRKWGVILLINEKMIGFRELNVGWLRDNIGVVGQVDGESIGFK